MSKENKNTPVVAAATGVNSNEVLSAEQIITKDKAEAEKAATDKVVADKAESEKVAADKAAADKVHDVTIIPSGKFIAENGNEYEFNVSSFTFQGKTYTKEEALSDHTDVLEHLASVKSFILKKV